MGAAAAAAVATGVVSMFIMEASDPSLVAAARGAVPAATRSMLVEPATAECAPADVAKPVTLTGMGMAACGRGRVERYNSEILQ